MLIKTLKDERGFTYIAMLVAVVVMGIALGITAEVSSTIAKREREAELIFRGNAIKVAVGSYYNSSPGVKRFPKKIEELVEDKRFPVPKRHLRKLYSDPMTGKANWNLIRMKNGASIIGVSSKSEEVAFKTSGFPGILNEYFEGKENYS
ncbi:type II secretion system protein, partial [bacterium]|nr:type II secretion system protein [bacterium]